MELSNLTVDFWPFGSVMVCGPIPWQHSWQIERVKNDSKSTCSCCSFATQAAAIGRRICLNLLRINRFTKYPFRKIRYWRGPFTIVSCNFNKPEILGSEMLLSLRNILKHDHWWSPVFYNTLIIWKIESKSLWSLDILK